MRARPSWQRAEHGVMLYMPAPRVSLRDTEQTLSRLSIDDDASSGVQTQLPEVKDTVMPSCEDGTGTKIKTESPVQYLELPLEDSPDLAPNDTGEIFADAVHVTYPGSSSSTSVSKSSDLFSQLVAAAACESSVPDLRQSGSSQLSSTSTLTEDFVFVDYDSENTDFQQESPCPTVVHNNARQKRKSAFGKTSHHFQRNPQHSGTKSPVRRLSFASELKKQLAKRTTRSKSVQAPKSENAQALDRLRSVERTPRRIWDEDERELLCIINRWYCAKDHTTELTVFSKIFNAVTGLDLDSRKIGIQFTHIRYYGGDAYHSFRRVFAVPFDDPMGQYAAIRALIESTADTHCLDLQRRQSEPDIQSGMARYADSPKTRKFYLNLVQKASQDDDSVRESHQISAKPRSITSMAMALQLPEDDNLEIITDTESSPISSHNSAQVHNLNPAQVHDLATVKPHLAFRVWDAASRTRFIDGGFLANTFLGWPLPLPSPPPIALDDPTQSFKIYSSLHLSQKGGLPVFISTASSLLQAIVYAMDMDQPRLALINLDAPPLQEPNKVHHAADVLPWLKSEGINLWARYRGNGEYFVWSDIPGEAILHTADLTSLVTQLNNDPDCRRLLNFDAFRAGARTKQIAAALRERNALLNTATARALGRIAKLFGMGKSNVTLDHIADLVSRLIDGWSITKSDFIDIQTMSTLAATFATALGSHVGGYTLQDVMGAFMEGVDHGMVCMDYWSKSRSGSRRQRFREV